MKIAAGIIIFNSDFVLKQVLESIYPHVSQILISEGCVGYWVQKGFTTSLDNTNKIIENFPDPDKKITIVHGTYTEKTEQANAYMKYVHPDTDYVWNLDADEVFKFKHIIKIKQLLATGKYTSIGFKSFTFYGGFDRYLSGFEREHDFVRIQKYHPGAMWSNHRPPTIDLPFGQQKVHFDGNKTAEMGILMYHYSYVFPRQVFEKIQYYESAVISKGNCIPNYFNEVYLPWVMGDHETKFRIEQQYKGVHEFMPHARGECYTEQFVGTHPEIILRDMDELKQEFTKQITPFLLNKID